jgi:hypothetical protein
VATFALLFNKNGTMKKTLLFSLLAVAANALYSQCSELFISEYVEGTNNNKALEIYNPTPNPIGMNGNYRLIRYNNGTGAAAGEANSQAMINLGNHVIQPYDVFVVVIEKLDPNQPCPGQECMVDPELQALADTFLCPVYDVSYAMYFNGNDALSLQKYNGSSWNYVDIFGMIGDPAMVAGEAWSDEFPYDGSAGSWWTVNQTLVRKESVQQGVSVNPSPFFNVTLEYDSLPNEDWTRLGSHTCSCLEISVNERTAPVVNVFPNPSTDGRLLVRTSEPATSVQLFNLLGQNVPVQSRNQNGSYTELYAEQADPGVYFVRVNFSDSRSTVVKVTIK